MKLTNLFGSALLAAGFLGALPAQAQDAAAGKKVFDKCTACHDATTDKNKVGPSLLGVVGRTAGTLESYRLEIFRQHERSRSGRAGLGRRQPHRISA